MAKKILYTYFIFTFLSLWIGIITHTYSLLLVPFLLWLIAQSILDFRIPYFLLIACIPLSIEYHISPSLGLDLPTEPILIGLTGVYILFIFVDKNAFDKQKMLQNPLIYLLLLGWIWAGISTFFSTVGIVSVKWLLAKTWYLLTCIGISMLVFKEKNAFKTFYFCLISPLLFTIIWALWGQAHDHFSFQLVNKALSPFYRNHVNYASLLALSFPFVWYGKKHLQNLRMGNVIWLFSAILMLLGIYFSYTRIAYIALLIAPIAYFIIRFKAMKMSLIVLSFLVVGGISYLLYDNNYMNISPKYEKTISPKDFNSLWKATYEGQDVSSMERVNRWVAGRRMAGEHLWAGFGPNSFYPQYQQYALADFRTYVSFNKEASTVHCYYFLILLEQGLPGFLLFMAFIFVFLLKGEKIYHQQLDSESREIVMTALLSQIIILVILLFNDMIETDKVGILFYINVAILYRKEQFASLRPS